MINGFVAELQAKKTQVNEDYDQGLQDAIEHYEHRLVEYLKENPEQAERYRKDTRQEIETTKKKLDEIEQKDLTEEQEATVRRLRNRLNNQENIMSIIEEVNEESTGK